MYLLHLMLMHQQCVAKSPPPVTANLLLDLRPTISRLWQDAAMTTPVTADGDPVGALLDGSPNAYVFRQTTGADRPTYKTDGTREWLLSSGSRHLVCMASDLTTVVPINITSDMTIYQAFERASAGILSMGLGGVPITTENPLFWYDVDNKIYYGLPSAQVTSAADTSTGNVTMTTRRLSTGPRATLRKNGAQIHDSTAGAGALSGSLRYLLRVSGSHHSGKWYGSVAYSAGHADASVELSAMETYMASLMP